MPGYNQAILDAVRDADHVFGPSGEEAKFQQFMRGENELLRYLSEDGHFRLERVVQPRSYNMPRHHQHSFFELYYLISGSRYYYIRGRTYLLRPNDIILIPPNTHHKTLDTGQGGHDRFLIHFEREMFMNEPSLLMMLDQLFAQGQAIAPGESVGESRSQDPVRSILRPVREDRQTLQAILRRILIEMERAPKEPSAALMLTGLMRMFLATTCRANQNTTLQAEEATLEEDADIVAVLEYINEHYREELQVAELAEKFYMSRYHLSRKFKESTGFTILEYIHSVRVLAAQDLLVNSDLPISAIVSAVGFGSSSQFTRIFKQITGYTPSKYRGAFYAHLD